MHPLGTLITSTILLLPLSAPIAAQPTLERRGLPGAVYTCTDTDFSGDCQWSAPTTRCRQQGPSGSGIEALGPDHGSKCVLYEKSDCTGKVIDTVRYPGYWWGLPEFGAFSCSAE